MTHLQELRRQKDALFRDHPHSPLLPEQRQTFTGLRYYAEDPSLGFDVAPVPFDQPETVSMQTSTGDEQTYLRWAQVQFSIDGRELALTVFRDPEGGYFLPFTDAGRGVETYGAGRYLDPEELPDGKLRIDFNLAYNPYCAYNDEWSCPLPPPENHLPVHVRAGERNFEH